MGGPAGLAQVRSPSCEASVQPAATICSLLALQQLLHPCRKAAPLLVFPGELGSEVLQQTRELCRQLSLILAIASIAMAAAMAARLRPRAVGTAFVR